MLQDNIFMQSEGDRWFERNRSALSRFDPGADLCMRLIDLYDLRPESVLEIGAANGFRLAAIHTRTAARVVGVEPSARAILEGKASYPFVSFVRALAHAIPLRERFELVIVNFVFHWIDRARLLESMSEADRLVGDGGFLIVGDFHPAHRWRVRYHHLADQDVHTYKQNYAEPFLACGLYHPVCLLTADHGTKKLDARAGEDGRIGAWLLRKQTREHYMMKELDGRRG